jgi:hypothetical protein
MQYVDKRTSFVSRKTSAMSKRVSKTGRKELTPPRSLVVHLCAAKVYLALSHPEELLIVEWNEWRGDSTAVTEYRKGYSCMQTKVNPGRNEQQKCSVEGNGGVG